MHAAGKQFTQQINKRKILYGQLLYLNLQYTFNENICISLCVSLTILYNILGCLSNYGIPLQVNDALDSLDDHLKIEGESNPL